MILQFYQPGNSCEATMNGDGEIGYFTNISAKLFEDIPVIKGILQDAEEDKENKVLTDDGKWKKSGTESLLNRYRTVFGIGEFLSQSLFHVAVESLGCNTEDKIRSSLKVIAASFDVTLLTPENISCEITRTRKPVDVFNRGQNLYDVNNSNNSWIMVEKVYGKNIFQSVRTYIFTQLSPMQCNFAMFSIVEQG